MLLLMLLVFSCSPYTKMKRIMSGEVGLGMYVPDDGPEPEEEDPLQIDSIRSTLAEHIGGWSDNNECDT